MGLPDPRTKIPAPQPGIGRIVHYRSRTGDYTVPAIITATVQTLAQKGVDAFTASEGARGVPPLSGDLRVHLTVFTPGLPGQRAGADDFQVESEFPRSENFSGCYQEWDVPLDDAAEGEQAPGTWRWPVLG